MNSTRYGFFAIFVLFGCFDTLLAAGLEDVVFGFERTTGFESIHHLVGVVGLGIWANQTDKARSAKLSLLFLLSLGVSCLMGMSMEVSFDLRPVVAGEIVLLGLFVARSLGLNAAWDVVAVMMFGLLNGVMIGTSAKGEAPMFFPLGVVLSGIVLLLAGAIATWVFGIRKANGSSGRFSNAPSWLVSARFL